MTDFFEDHAREINLDLGLMAIEPVFVKRKVFLQRAYNDHSFDLLHLSDDFGLRKKGYCEKQT